MKNYLVTIKNKADADTFEDFLSNSNYMFTEKNSDDETYFIVSSETKDELKVVEKSTITEIQFLVEDADKEIVPLPQPNAQYGDVPVYDAETEDTIRSQSWAWVVAACISAVVVIVSLFL